MAAEKEGSPLLPSTFSTPINVRPPHLDIGKRKKKRGEYIAPAMESLNFNFFLGGGGGEAEKTPRERKGKRSPSKYFTLCSSPRPTTERGEKKGSGKQGFQEKKDKKPWVGARGEKRGNHCH